LLESLGYNISPTFSSDFPYNKILASKDTVWAQDLALSEHFEENTSKRKYCKRKIMQDESILYSTTNVKYTALPTLPVYANTNNHFTTLATVAFFITQWRGVAVVGYCYGHSG
jgi:hypothetical protein